MNVAAASDFGRRLAESLMTSTCTIRATGSGEHTTDEEGVVTHAKGDVMYAGPCRVRPASGAGGNSAEREAGGAQVFTFDYLVSVPFSVTAVTEGMRCRIDSSPDPSLVGVDVEVQHVDRGEHITARRLQCSEVA